MHMYTDLIWVVADFCNAKFRLYECVLHRMTVHVHHDIWFWASDPQTDAVQLD